MKLEFLAIWMPMLSSCLRTFNDINYLVLLVSKNARAISTTFTGVWTNKQDSGHLLKTCAYTIALARGGILRLY